MGIESAKRGKLLYHLTELSNLDSIIENGLAPRKALVEFKAKFADVANPDIISKRESLGLDAYTPFHFHPYSSFDVAVKNAHPDSEFIYICIKRALARENHFKILPMHPLSIEDEFRLFEYDEGFEAIDWDTLMERGRTDDYAKHVKMAECLTDLLIPIDCFHSIVVKNESSKEVVENKLRENGVAFPPPFVDIQSWF